jgi:hypothetical protein
MSGFNLDTLLGGLKAAAQIGGQALLRADDFRAMFEEGRRLLANADDQATAKEAYADLIAENDEGFARLDAKLEAAKNK